MIRSLILAAACSLGALVPALVPVLRGGNGGAWDPRESRASLFLGATGRGESRSVYRRTVETFRNWTDKAPASGTTGFVIGRGRPEEWSHNQPDFVGYRDVNARRQRNLP